MVEKLVFLVKSVLLREVLVLQIRELGCDVWQHEQLLVVHFLCQPFRSLVCKVNGIQLLVNDKIQWFNSFRHAAVVVLHVNLFSLQHSRLDAVFREIFDEWLVLWKGLM